MHLWTDVLRYVFLGCVGWRNLGLCVCGLRHPVLCTGYGPCACLRAQDMWGCNGPLWKCITAPAVLHTRYTGLCTATVNPALVEW